MNTASYVDNLIAELKASGCSKEEAVVKLAEACVGWPYVYGARGEKCTPSIRKRYYNNYTTRNPGEAEQIKKNCEVMCGKASCANCKFYPGGDTRCYDCRGFSYWVLLQFGIKIQGGGATSQWNDNTNWEVKGTIDQYNGQVACFFQRDTKKPNVMSHTGLLVGNNMIVHCSGTVKKEKLYKKITHFAVPKGLDGGVVPGPTPTPTPTHSTIKRGSVGDDVKYCQSLLIKLGYDLGAYGADGKFGAKTETAVKAFQTSKNLKADGIVGKATWAALEEAAGGDTPQPAPVEKLYTLTIPHLTVAGIDALKAVYTLPTGAIIIEE